MTTIMLSYEYFFSVLVDALRGAQVQANPFFSSTKSSIRNELVSC